MAASTRGRNDCDCMVQFSLNCPGGSGQLWDVGGGAGLAGPGLLGAGMVGAGMVGTGGGVTEGTGMMMVGGAGSTVAGATGVSGAGSSSVMVWHAASTAAMNSTAGPGPMRMDNPLE